MTTDTWEWLDGKGNWSEYSKPVVYLLEAASLFGLATVKVTENKKDYIVDMIKKVQTTKTGRGSKNIRRIKTNEVGKFVFCGVFAMLWGGGVFLLHQLSCSWCFRFDIGTSQAI